MDEELIVKYDMMVTYWIRVYEQWIYGVVSSWLSIGITWFVFGA